MSNANSIRAGKAFVELFADHTRLVKGLKEAKKYVTDFGNGLKDVGTNMFAGGSAIVAPLIAAAHTYQSMGDAVANASERTGMAAAAFSALAYAANQADVGMETLEGGLRKMQKTIGAAIMGSKSASETLKQLGLSTEALKDTAPESQFALIADRLARIEDPAVRASMAMKIFGRGGAALLPMMQDGAAGIQSMMLEAQRLGVVISNQDAKAAAEFEGTLKKLWATLKAVTFHIGAAVAPMLKGMAEWLTLAAANVTGFIKAHQDLIRNVMIGAGIVAGFGAALIGVGIAVKVVASIIGGVIKTINFFYDVIGAAIKVVGFLFTTPLGWLTLLGVGITIVAYKLGAFDDAIQSMKTSMSELAKETTATFGAIANALKAGDITLAVKVLWSYIKLEWTSGTNWLANIWDKVLYEIKKVWIDFSYGFESLFAKGIFGWILSFDLGIKYMYQAWEGLKLSMIIGWENIMASAAKAWNYIKGLFKDFDVEAANKKVDEQKNAAITAAEQRTGNNFDAADVWMKKQLDEKLGILQELDDEFYKKEKGNESDLNSKISKRADEVKKLKTELEGLIKQANEAKPEEFAKNPKKMAETLDLSAAEVSKRMDVRGTFNAFAISSLNAANISTAERTAKSSEKTAEHTRRIQERLEEMDGAEFTD